MIPNFIPGNLIAFWIFFGFLSVLPLIMALVTQGRADRKEEEENK